MAFSDPQTVTIDGTAYTLARTGMGDSSGTFQDSAGDILLQFRHTYGARVRRNLKLTFNKVAPDPFQTDINTKYSFSVNVTFDAPAVGFTTTELEGVVDGVLAYLSADTDAAVAKMLGGES